MAKRKLEEVSAAEITTKKKKRKKDKTNINSSENDQDFVNSDDKRSVNGTVENKDARHCHSDGKEKKKKKKKHLEKEDHFIEVEKQNLPCDGDVEHLQKGSNKSDKKKKKHKQEPAGVGKEPRDKKVHNLVDESAGTVGVGEHSSCKKKRKKDKEKSKVSMSIEDVEASPKKKKKSNSKHTLEMDNTPHRLESNDNFCSENRLESNDNFCLENRLESNDNFCSENVERKKKHKKKKKEIPGLNVNDCAPKEDGLNEINSGFVVKEHRSKKKNSNVDIVKQSEEQTESINLDNVSKMEKHKKKKKQDKHTKLENSARSNVEEKDQTLQSPSDPKTGDLSVEEANTCKPVSTGQWGTADLGGQSQQEKFLRLLGGFKKGGNSTMSHMNKLFQNKGGNLAMNREQEEKYKTDMESGFQKAVDFNKQRGSGLGFEKPPGEGKKFHIDINKAKTKKFEDSD